MIRAIKSTLKVLVLWMVIVAIPTEAFAAASFTCKGYTLQDPNLPTLASCTASMSLQTVISTSICILRAVIAESMFQVYCGIVEDVEIALVAALTLWVIFYAIAYMFGIANTSGRDIVIRLFKVIIIFSLALNPELFFVYLYKFFIYGVLEGVSHFLFQLDPESLGAAGGGGGPPGSCTYKPSKDIVDQSDPSQAQQNIVGIFAYMDELFHKVIGEKRLLSFAVLIAAFAATGMGVIVSGLLMAGVWAMIAAFFRVVMTYIVALMALTFALMFAPLFLGFALFSRTVFFFQAWLGTIISYTLQPLILIAFIFIYAVATDLTDFTCKLIYINPDIAEPGLSAPSNVKIKIDFERTRDFIFQTFSQESPNYSKLDGTSSEDATEFKGDFKEAVYFALAFLILNTVLNTFLKQVPGLAQQLSQFAGVSSAPAITTTPNAPWGSGGSAQGAGVHAPDRFITQSAPWKAAEKSASRSGGILPDLFGKMFDTGPKGPKPPTTKR